jgi:hypothetical protein
MSNDETKMKSGIQILQLMLHTNLAKKQLPLTSDLFTFPNLSEQLSGLEKYPYTSVNVKYDEGRLKLLQLHEIVQIFFNKINFIQFLSNLPIEIPTLGTAVTVGTMTATDKMQNDVAIHNLKTMMNYLFPMSFPVIRTVKQKSNMGALNFGNAFIKEFLNRKYNTYLKIDGKSCTIDEVVLLDTFDTNPVYKKLYELAEKYIVNRDIALAILLPEIIEQVALVLTELTTGATGTTVSGTTLSDIISAIVEEIQKLKNDKNKNNTKKKELKEDLDELTDKEKTQNKEIAYLTDLVKIEDRLKKGSNKTIRDIKNDLNNIIAEFKGTVNNDFTDSNENTRLIANAKIKKKELETQLNDLVNARKQLDTKKVTKQNEKNALKTEKGQNTNEQKIPRDSIAKIDNAIDKLGLFNQINALKPIDTKEDVSKQDIETSKAKLETMRASIKQITRELAQITTSSSSTEFDAFNDATKITTILKLKTSPNLQLNTLNGFSNNIKMLTDKYYATDSAEKQKTTDKAGEDKRNAAITSICDNIKIVSSNLEKDIEQIKTQIDTLYESEKTFFINQKKEFMKLRKLVGIGYLLSTTFQYYESLEIETKYGINIQIDMKRAEYQFHRKIIEDLRIYYFPERQSMDPDIYNIFNGPGKKIDLDAVKTMFEDSRKNPKLATIDRINLQQNSNQVLPQIEGHAHVFGFIGIATTENGGAIKCHYENEKLGADMIREYFKLEKPHHFDLSKIIAKVEKEQKIQYAKVKPATVTVIDSTQSLPYSSSLPAPPSNLPPMPPMPPIRQSSSGDIDRYVSDYLNKIKTTIAPNTITTEINNNPKFANFVLTAIDLKTKRPSDKMPNSTKTYKENYIEIRDDATDSIKTTIRSNKYKLDNKNNPVSQDVKTKMEMENNRLTDIEKIFGLIDASFTIKGGKQKTRKHNRQNNRNNKRKSHKRKRIHIAHFTPFKI